MNNTLVIVTCAQKKIWDANPATGPTQAQYAYHSDLFSLHRAWAVKQGGRWLILSAKYGFIWPEFEIAVPYNVTFNTRATGPITLGELKAQVAEMGLERFSPVIGLGGKEYRQMIQAAFSCEVQFPFAGLPIGKLMQALRRELSKTT